MSEKRGLEVPEVNEVVVTTAKEIHAVIVSKIKDVRCDQQWLIYGRILNYLYHGLFKPRVHEELPKEESSTV